MKNIPKLSLITLIFGFIILFLLSFVLADSSGVTYTPSSSSTNGVTISDINIPTSIEMGTSGSFDVLITNSGNNEGVLVSASSEQLSIYPSNQNIELSNSTIIHLTYTAKNSEGSGNVCVQVCTTNQFGDNGCINKCKLFSIMTSSSNSPQNISSNNLIIIIVIIIAVAIIVGFVILAIILSRRGKQ